MQTAPPRGQRAAFIGAWLLMALPVCAFFYLLQRTAVPLPILDDYQIILGLLNGLHDSPTVGGRLHLLFVDEHNGYKLVFENLCIALDRLVFPPFNLPVLIGFGNALAFVVLVVVCAMARLNRSLGAVRWFLLAPLAPILMQLQYASALNFASSSLQHVAVILFSLLAMLLLSKSKRWTFAASVASLALAVASSPNGFFASPPGLLLLAQQKRWRAAVLWSAATLALLCGYLYQYQPDRTMPAGAHGPHGHINLLYALSFVGAAAARYSSVMPSLVLGAALGVVFLLMTAQGYSRSNPAVYASVLFILINAVAVSGLRADQGVAQSLASRYRLYSALFLAFAYLFAVERWCGAGIFTRTLPSRRACYTVASAAFLLAGIFAAISDLAGARFLEGKKEALLYVYRTEWLGQAQTKIPQPSNPALRKQLRDGVFAVNLPALREAVRNGVYQPPQNP